MRTTWMLVLILVALLVAQADAGEFRRIGELPATGSRASLHMEDWDGDGDLELIHEDEIEQPYSSHASWDLYLVRIFEPREGKWAIVQAFIGSAHDPNDSEDDAEAEKFNEVMKPGTVSVQKIDGDFSSDGVQDSLVVETTMGTDVFFPERCELRLVQGDAVLFKDEFKEIYAFERFQVIDLDKDGAQEVLVWFSEAYWDVPKAYVFGTPKSQWKAKNPLSELMPLSATLAYLRQTRAKLDKEPAPVSATLTAVSSQMNAPDEKGFEVTTYRFRVELSANEGSGITDLKPWRDYFMKWSIGFVSDDATSLAGVEQARKLRWSVSGDNALEFETEFPRDVGWVGPGEYTFWLECSYAQRAPNPFGWSGTVVTPGIPLEIDTWRNIKDER